MCDCDKTTRPPHRAANEGPMQAEAPMQAARRTAGLALRQRARDLRRQADGLDALARLADALDPGGPGEQALHDLVMAAGSGRGP